MLKRVMLVAAMLLCFAIPSQAAELLVLAFNTYGSDAEQDRFAWKLGHIVDIRPDGAVYGAQETLPKFWIIKVAGMTVSEAAAYLAPLMDENQGVDVGIRKWKLDTDKMTGAVRNKLVTEGVLSVTRTQALNYLSLITQ